ncbi:hypothetical protein A7J57_04920 [Agrobacterium tumefaciens]|uniref:Uncharacterized protein n=1 Tax=Agrobacterium tumefaciens TaxID=358 RepID=A0A176X786_AGRTU|nr:hypothetical protein A7J57_04920 [Agrobacterium tumefaciens]
MYQCGRQPFSQSLQRRLVPCILSYGMGNRGGGMRSAAVPISILLGFAILGAAIHTKENDFETCIRLYKEHVAKESWAGREVVIVRECTGQ